MDIINNLSMLMWFILLKIIGLLILLCIKFYERLFLRFWINFIDIFCCLSLIIFFPSCYIWLFSPYFAAYAFDFNHILYGYKVPCNAFRRKIIFSLLSFIYNFLYYATIYYYFYIMIIILEWKDTSSSGCWEE